MISEIRVARTDEPDGAVTYHVTIPATTLKRTQDWRFFWIADMEKTLPEPIDCCGFAVRPRMILKVFCKVPPHIAAKLYRKHTYESLRSKRPVLF